MRTVEWTYRRPESKSAWRPRLILDTSVVRAIATDRASTRGLRSFRQKGGAVHIADGAAVELCAQIDDGRIRWPDWLWAREALERVLDEEEPIIMGGHELLAAHGMVLSAAPSRFSASDQRAWTKATWRLLCEAKTPAELRKATASIVPSTSQAGLGFDLTRAAETVSKEKESWISYFEDRLPDAINAARATRPPNMRHGSFEEKVLELGQFLDARASPSEPPASVRMDAMARMHLLLSERSMQARHRYNSTKHANDVFDLDLLRYLALPAAVCTEDTGIMTKLKDARAKQRAWVVSLSDLANDSTQDRLLCLRWKDLQ